VIGVRRRQRGRDDAAGDKGTSGPLRSHWLAALLLAAGLALRVLAQVTYRPALLYVDTLKYLYNAYPGADPVGYKVPLKVILAVGNLDAVAAVQHLVGLAIAVAVYVMLIRLGVARWLAALAIAPILLDAYQIQIEQTIMPDVWFEAVIVAGIALLLSRRIMAGLDGERFAPGLLAVVAGGLVLGISATFRQVGEVLILPALLYLLAAGGGWRTVAIRWIALAIAFAVPIVGYMAGSDVITGRFQLDTATARLSTYGRMATAADCATLRIPAYERPLCPSARARAFGIDWLDHDSASPLKTYVAPAGMNRYAVIAKFDEQVVVQQPQRVLAAVARDAVKLFALTRTASEGGTPISRWQFQDFYPTYYPWVNVHRDGTIVLGLPPRTGTRPMVRHQLDPGYGGKATVNRPIAEFLRAYQLGGGYTPGPLMAIFALAGLAGSLLGAVRRRNWAGRGLALGCLLFFGSGVAILVMSDLFEFTWRYQLPALVTLPPAGALGVAAALSYFSRRRHGGTAAQPDEIQKVTSPAA
jgi:hypothetical protein